MKILSGQVLFLATMLITIIGFMILMKRGQLSYWTEAKLPEFENSFQIIGNQYYNKLYHFGVSMPNSDWEIIPVEGIDSLGAFNTQQSLIANTTVFVQICRRDKTDTLSVARIGIIPLVEPRTPDSMAKQSLNEMKAKFQKPDIVRIIRDVTITGINKLRGACYLLELPQPAHAS